jgi:hypothetical protein
MLVGVTIRGAAKDRDKSDRMCSFFIDINAYWDARTKNRRGVQSG